MWRLVVPMLMFGGVAAALYVVYLALPRVADESQLWFEAAKAAMSAISVGFFGVIVGFFVKNRDEQRERDRLLLDYRRRFLLDVVETYGRVKAARRALRVNGLGPGGSKTLTVTHLADLDSGCDAVSEGQLTFERLLAEVSAHEAFSQGATIGAALGRIKLYLNEVVTEWDNGRPSLRPGHSASGLAGWVRFKAFLASVRFGNGDFGVVSDAMNEIEAAIWADVLKRPPVPVKSQ